MRKTFLQISSFVIGVVLIVAIGLARESFGRAPVPSGISVIGLSVKGTREPATLRLYRRSNGSRRSPHQIVEPDWNNGFDYLGPIICI